LLAVAEEEYNISCTLVWALNRLKMLMQPLVIETEQGIQQETTYL
jgi:hypothetical protein